MDDVTLSPARVKGLTMIYPHILHHGAIAGVVIPPFLALARNRGQAARANFCLGVMPPRAIFGLS